MTTRLTINGQRRAIEAAADTPLLWVLRDELGLTGTKFGCGAGLCGACTVHLNGQATRSCLVPIGSLEARRSGRSRGCPGTARILSRRPGSRNRSRSAAIASPE